MLLMLAEVPLLPYVLTMFCSRRMRVRFSCAAKSEEGKGVRTLRKRKPYLVGEGGRVEGDALEVDQLREEEVAEVLVQSEDRRRRQERSALRTVSFCTYVCSFTCTCPCTPVRVPVPVAVRALSCAYVYAQ